MPSDHTPSISPYRVPDSTDAPDVPTHIREYANRMTQHGFRTRWNASLGLWGSPTGTQTLSPGYAGVIADVGNSISPSTYAPRCITIITAYATVGNLGSNAAGYVGITNDQAGGSYIIRHRWASPDPQGQFALACTAVHYNDPSTQNGWGFYVSVDPLANSLTIRTADIIQQSFPINQ